MVGRRGGRGGWWSGMGVGETVASGASPRAGAARSPLCTLAHTNSRENAEAAGGVLAAKRCRMMQTKNSEPPAVGPRFRPASDRRASSEALRACEVAAAAILVQSHCRRRRAQRIAAEERRRVYRRKQIIREIHTSELSYHSSLRVLDEHYMQQVMWKRANTVAALPTIEMAPPTAPGTPVAASPTATAGIPVSASPKGTPIASTPMGTPSGSTRGRSGKRGRRGSVDSNIAALTAKLAARATSATSIESRLDFPTAEEVDTMFCGGALMCLIDLSRQLTIQLDDVASGDAPACCGAARKVGEIFTQLAPRFLIFSEYCKRTEEAMEMVTECHAKYPTFGHFMSHLQSVPASPAGLGGDGAGGTLDLLSYLIMPVQRVPRYVMLLTELLDTIPAEDSASCEMVARALEVVRESAVQIDNAVGAEQRRIRLQQVMTSLRDAPMTFDTGVANRTLVREGRVQLIEKDQTPESSQLNVSLASISSHFGLGTPKAATGGGTLTPNRSVGGTPGRLSLGGTPNRRRPKLRRKSVCIEPDRRCYGNHLALLFNDCFLITKPFQNEFGHEKLRWVNCVWLKGATVDPNCIEYDDTSQSGFHIFNSVQNGGETEPELDGENKTDKEDPTPDSPTWVHTLVVKDAASKTEWLSDLERTIKSAPEPPAAINLSSPQSNDADRLEAIGTPIELPQVDMSPLPTTPIRALKNALQRGKRASSGRNLRRGLRRKSTADASADAAAALASSPVADEFRVSQDGSLMGDALPESDADAAALRDAMLEQLHALISLDMRKFLLESNCTGTLSEWAIVSDWAHDTGGGVEERRAERGVWLRLFATVQRELAPQFGLDAEAMTAPVLDSPAGPQTECSPVLENATELPVLDFSESLAMRVHGEADGSAEEGGLTLNLPPLASTPLSTRSRQPLARASAGACCTAVQTSPTLSLSTEVDNSEDERENITTTENQTGAEEDSRTQQAVVYTDSSATSAVPSEASDGPVPDPATLAQGDVNVDIRTAPSSPLRTPRAGPETPSSDQQQRSTRRKRRRSSFACCAAAGSP
eukprot:COSAG02_NODE_2381_length_8995_cov_3.430980_8_plen_1048_part_00